MVDHLKERLDRLLMSLLGSTEMVNLWWLSNNKAFDGQTPAQTYKKDPDRIKQYILGQFSGDYL